MIDVSYFVRPELTNTVLNELFAATWRSHSETDFGSVLSRSLTWVGALRGDRLIGYVNVATDGGAHAFLLDTTVHPDEQRQGIGRRLVVEAAESARAAGAIWLHVDYESHLDGFYRSCGFSPTAAGLLALNRPEPDPGVDRTE